MSWTALIPLNAPTQRKSRLSGVLGAAQRESLTEALHRHVLDCVERAGVFEASFTLSPAGVVTVGSHWVQREPVLNVELARIRNLFAAPLLVLNADLPWLEPEDVRVLVAAAERDGCAIAPDRHGTGTNAVALLPDAPFEFAFGPGSLALHRRAPVCVVDRPGLAFDLDTPTDLADMLASGHALSDRVERTLWPHAVTSKWAHVD